MQVSNGDLGAVSSKARGFREEDEGIQIFSFGTTAKNPFQFPVWYSRTTKGLQLTEWLNIFYIKVKVGCWKACTLGRRGEGQNHTAPFALASQLAGC